MIKGITEQQKDFCRHYVKNRYNGTQAAKDAGYKPTSAHEQAHRLIKQDKIQQYIKKVQQAALQEAKVDTLLVLQELKNAAFSDITTTIGLGVEGIQALPAEIRRLIQKFKRTVRHIPDGQGGTNQEETIELVFIDKLKALDMINRHIDFYGEQQHADEPVKTISLMPASMRKAV